MAQTGATVVVYELGEHSRVALAEGRLQLTTGEHGCTIQVGAVVWEVLLDQLVFRLSPYEYVFHLADERQLSITLAMDTPTEQTQQLHAALAGCAALRSPRGGVGTAAAAAGAATTHESTGAAEVAGAGQAAAAAAVHSREPQPAEHEWVARSQAVADAMVWGASSVALGIRTWGAVMESGLQSGSKAIVQNTARSRQPVEVSESTLRQLGDARATTAKGTAIAQDLQQGAMEVTDHVAHSLTGLMQDLSAAAPPRSSPSSPSVPRDEYPTPPSAPTTAPTASTPQTHQNARFPHFVPQQASRTPRAEEAAAEAAAAKALRTVTLASVRCMEDVVGSVVDAARAVARGSAAATTEVVEHKLGERAGLAAADSLHTVGNVLEGAYALAMMGPRAVAKRGLASSLRHAAAEDPASTAVADANHPDGGGAAADLADHSGVEPTPTSTQEWMLRDLHDEAPLLEPL